MLLLYFIIYYYDFPNTVHIVLYGMYVTMSISIGLYPKLDLWNANKLHYYMTFDFLYFGMYVTMSISIGLYPKLDLWNANKLHYITTWPLTFYIS